MNPSSTNLIGVVAIGRNEGERLVRCLESLQPGRCAIVYVDSASTDGSAARARAMGATVVDLDLARPFTAARARNAGFAALKERAPAVTLVQFIDGDCELAPGWLDTAAMFLDAHPDVAAVCGRRRERFPRASVYNRIADLEWDTPVGEAAAVGGDALMRVAAYEAAGGFDDAIMAGEEPELCARMRGLGWRVFRIDAEMTLHDAAMTRLRQYWLRGVRSGFGYAQVWRERRLFGRELGRAALWAGALPGAAIIGALAWWPLALLAPAVLGLQVARMARRQGWGSRFGWQVAALSMLAKFAELGGAIRFFLSRRTRSAIDYKHG